MAIKIHQNSVDPDIFSLHDEIVKIASISPFKGLAKNELVLTNYLFRKTYY